MKPESQQLFSDVFKILQERFAALNIAVVMQTPEGRLDDQAPHADLLRALFACAPARRRIEAAFSDAGPGSTGTVELFSGATLISAESRRARRREPQIAALVLSSPDPSGLRDIAEQSAWEKFIAASPDSQLPVVQAERFLRWSMSDLARAQAASGTISQFGNRLTQAYEETHLLFRMARLLNVVTAPEQLIQIVVNQVHEIMPFRWIAVQFNHEGGRVHGVSGRTFHSGQLPAEVAHFDELARPLLDQSTADSWTRVMPVDANDLSRTAQSEILAEPITHDGQTIGMLIAGNKSADDPEISSFEIQFLEATADFLGIFHENLSRFEEQRAMFLGTVRAVSASIDAKDHYTRGHSDRVALLASQMAAALGMPEAEVEQYRIAGLVHDVGKIGVPEAVLCKAGKLTNEEFAAIKLHPEIGYGILQGVPLLQKVLPGVLHHHEKWDGTGYPHRIGGEQIPYIARILALADVFDAMSSTRSYRAAMTREAVIAEIQRSSGRHFDPELVPVLLNLDFTEFDRALNEQQPDLARQPRKTSVEAAVPGGFSADRRTRA